MAEHGFKAVDEPSYDLVSVKKDEGFVATATTPLQPELNLTQTTGFHVECVTPAVTDKEIDAVLERRRLGDRALHHRRKVNFLRTT